MSAQIEPHAPVALFNGHTPEAVIQLATDAADQLADVIKQRHLYKRIGSNEHILIEGWQTLGALVGVFAIESGIGVREMPWPMIDRLGEEPHPQDPGHDAWEYHRTLLAQRDLGRCYGYAAAYRAMKDGREVGWGEGRCCRGEKTWVSRDDYALASMAQTRGQSRALSAPLRFIVKLAGYEGTPADEMDGTEAAAAPAAIAPPPAPASLETINPAQEADLVGVMETIWPGSHPGEYLDLLRTKVFTDGIPLIASRALRGWAWWCERDGDPENAPPDPDASAYHQAPPDG